jgi:hypothetical protein
MLSAVAAKNALTIPQMIKIQPIGVTTDPSGRSRCCIFPLVIASVAKQSSGATGLPRGLRRSQ